MRRRAVTAVARAAAHVIDAATPASRPVHHRRVVSGFRSPFDATPRPRTPVARVAPTDFPRRLSADASASGTRDRASIITPALAARLDATVRRRDDLLRSLVADPPPPPREMASINKELSRVELVVAAWDRVRARREEHASLTSVLEDAGSDEELKAMAEDERDDVETALRSAEERLAVLLLPRDAGDDASGAVVEVRAGAGGDEAALFAADLLKMYELHAKRRGWRFEMLSSSRQESGGFREAAASLEAVGSHAVSNSNAFETDSAYSALRFESGVHRVQRVPATETQGRVHTSTASVAVLPQLDDLDMDGLVREEDVRVDTMRASGAGGQHVNTTNSAVRLTHAPTNTVVICQDERSQHKNKDKAFKVLRARVAEAKRTEAHASRADARRGLIGSGDRSERVRTYNFKEGRVKDHRVNHLSNDLVGFLSGGDALREMLDVLEREDRKRRLEAFDEAFGK